MKITFEDFQELVERAAENHSIYYAADWIVDMLKTMDAFSRYVFIQTACEDAIKDLRRKNDELSRLVRNYERRDETCPLGPHYRDLHPCEHCGGGGSDDPIVLMVAKSLASQGLPDVVTVPWGDIEPRSQERFKEVARSALMSLLLSGWELRLMGNRDDVVARDELGKALRARPEPTEESAAYDSAAARKALNVLDAREGEDVKEWAERLGNDIAAGPPTPSEKEEILKELNTPVYWEPPPEPTP